MPDLDFDIIAGAIILIVSAGGLAITVIKHFVDIYKQRKSQEAEQPYFEQQLFEYKATVIEKYCQVESYGSEKMPDYIEEMVKGVIECGKM